MTNNRKVQTALIAAICLGVTTWIGALVFTGSSLHPERWRTVDDFRQGLPKLLASSDQTPGTFDIQSLARQLYSVRVDGLPVCSPDEVSAQQYIYLSDIAQKLERFRNAAGQLDSLLEKPDGITDCQFRVLDGATFIPNASKG